MENGGFHTKFAQSMPKLMTSGLTPKTGIRTKSSSCRQPNEQLACCMESSFHFLAAEQWNRLRACNPLRPNVYVENVNSSEKIKACGKRTGDIVVNMFYQWTREQRKSEKKYLSKDTVFIQLFNARKWCSNEV